MHLVEALSRERLQTLIDLTASETESILLHQQALQLGTDLMKVVATVEIAIRNAVVANLSHHFGVENWLQQPPVAFVWKDIERSKISQAVDSARRAAYSKLGQADKGALDALAYPEGRPPNTSHLKRAKDRRKHIIVSEGKVIAELTLYFWKKLYGSEYDHSLWRATLKRTFPEKSVKRAEVASNLEIIYQVRNRLAHHEPVLHKRFSDVIQAIGFVIGKLGSPGATDDTPLSRLLANDMERLLKSEEMLSAKLDSFRSAKAVTANPARS